MTMDSNHSYSEVHRLHEALQWMVQKSMLRVEADLEHVNRCKWQPQAREFTGRFAVWTQGNLKSVIRNDWFGRVSMLVRPSFSMSICP